MKVIVLVESTLSLGFQFIPFDSERQAKLFVEQIDEIKHLTAKIIEI